MNAYDMADEVLAWSKEVYGGGSQLKEAANMLRQQADRIVELERLTKEPTQLLAVPELMEKAGFIRKPKPLSDVEISLIAEEFTGADGLDVVDFGRAIQERHGIK